MSMDRDPNVYDRETQVYDRGTGSSNTLAYVIGGIVVALGLMAFLFYDGGGRDVSTTSSIGTQTEHPAAPTPPAAPPASITAPPMTPSPGPAPAPATPQQ